ncbi:NAD(P)H-binding protein, partial [Micromonospora chersina]
LTGADAVVFAAGAGPGSGAARKDTVDRAAAVLLADAAQRAGVRRYLLVSSMGVDRPPRAGTDEVWAAYLRAKKAAEDDVTARDLDVTVLRPGRLTDDAAVGRITLARQVDPGAVTRADVARVLLALLDAPDTAGLTLELVGGETPIGEAVRTVT